MSGETIKRPIRIVYAEDDKDISFPNISQILTMLGYTDGPTAIRTLRSNPDTSDIPIVVLSAYSDAKTRDECKQIGVDRFMSKPIDVDIVSRRGDLLQGSLPVVT